MEKERLDTEKLINDKKPETLVSILLSDAIHMD